MTSFTFFAGGCRFVIDLPPLDDAELLDLELQHWRDLFSERHSSGGWKQREGETPTYESLRSLRSMITEARWAERKAMRTAREMDHDPGDEDRADRARHPPSEHRP